jgi:hypothetical protein
MDSALQAYQKTGQQAFQDKIKTTAVAKTDGSSDDDRGIPVASAAEPPTAQTSPTVYMMPVVVQAAPPPPPQPRNCEPGNKIYLLGSGCR